MWLGLAPRTDTQLSGIDTSRWDGRLRRVRGRGKGTAGAMFTLALQATPLWAGVRQCLLVITHFTRGVRGRREATPRMGLEGPRRQSKMGSLFPGWTCAVDVGAVTTFTHGQCMARSNLNHAKWQGRGEGERSDHQQHALQVVFYVMLRYCGPLPPSAAEWVPALGLPAGLLGGTREWCVIVGSREECWKGGGLGAGRILALRRS